NQEFGSCIHGGVSDLLRGPVLRGASSGSDVNHPTRALVDEEEEKQRAEEEVVGLDEVAAPDVMGVVLHERGPGLASWSTTNVADVLLDGALAERDGELEHLTADPLRTPGAVLESDLSYQRDCVFGDA